ncbi:CWF19-like protein 2 isoform X2 [Centruroides sculpturatus]|uniref:CWF19-like protein 2 isoform X1 n=1 Tax=Centruroides sculpturatus TaxID=218467 RepID=UPI000C6E9CF8|nr:CWF19-like protein 2 isoform X1 [Centruroides sculpturatus]XP_023231807.1 CWF19-like protein 2 isoform X2 [Centruroides sculpturatus]
MFVSVTWRACSLKLIEFLNIFFSFLFINMGKDRLGDKDEKRKHKKKSKHPKKDKRKHNTSSESESESEQEWVEASTATNEKRDEWMNITAFIPTVSNKELKKRNKKENEPQSLSTIYKPGQHERELNPYWKDGGIGLPSESSYESTNERVLPEKTVGDAGLNWLRRAYKRIKEQAEEENRSMEEVAAERWGSLEKLEKLLAEAENKARENRFDTRQTKKKREYRRESFRDRSRNTIFGQFKKNKSDAYKSYKKQFKKIDGSVDSYNHNFTSTSEPKFTKVAPKWMKNHNKYQVENR